MTVLAAAAMIGKVLLILLVILAVILLLILFAPFTYQADIRKEGDDLAAKGSAGWLFHLIHAGFSYDKSEAGGSPELSVRVFGIPVLPLIGRIISGKKGKKKKKVKTAGAAKERVIRWEAPKKPTVQPGQRRTVVVETGKTKRPDPVQMAAARIQALTGKIRKAFHKLRKIIRMVSGWTDYLQTESFDRAKNCLIKEGTAIARHVLPGKIRGRIRFGADDPAKTGMIIGTACILYPVFPKELVIEPEFLDPCLDADVTVKGRIRLIVLLYHTARMLLKKDVRRLISRIRKQTGAKNGKKTNHKVRKKPWQTTMNFRTT